MNEQELPRIAVGIATAGRPLVLSKTVYHLVQQSRPPDVIAICPASAEDVDRASIDTFAQPLTLVSGVRGSCAQRNALIRESDADVMIFLDDDFLPATDFVEEVGHLFRRLSRRRRRNRFRAGRWHPYVGPRIRGGARLSRYGRANRGDPPRETYNAYGCNMVVRLGPVREHGIHFDEALPLYGWLEDLDFSRQLASYGRIVKSPRLRGVHLGTKSSGRSPARQLGYSQVANPLYLAGKGTMSRGRAIKQIGRNIVANTVHLAKPEPWIDRKGRLAGNLLAIGEFMNGRLHPSRILELT